jgi:hypothetical protein
MHRKRFENGAKSTEVEENAVLARNLIHKTVM